MYITRIVEELKNKDSHQVEFIQAVEEVLNSVKVLFDRHPEYEKMAILERLVEPERIIQFKVPWIDSNGNYHVNRGYRVQYNGVLGPYKGGLRFNPSVNLGIMKFLGFEQVFKNALTTLPIGGGKGGSDFDPRGKSDLDIMNFCQSFMSELYRHIGQDIDVPAGDMGVGAREIGYLYGQYRRLKAVSEPGVLTGKGIGYGGSYARKEATGYGLVYFVDEILKRNQDSFTDKKVIISGSGNVAIYAAEKVSVLGGKVIAMSDSKGYIIDENINLDTIKQIKEIQRGSLCDYPKLAGQGKYYEGSVYDHVISYDIALACATQNEIDLSRAMILKENGCKLVGEGANMPSTNEAIAFYLNNDIIFAPAKAANAGGVATSALEMSQNSMRMNWSYEEVDNKLHEIMVSIHSQCTQAIEEYNLDPQNYAAAANIAGMKKVIEAMIAQGNY